MMSKINIKAFCGTDDQTPWARKLLKPWISGGYQYAFNGHGVWKMSAKSNHSQLKGNYVCMMSRCRRALSKNDQPGKD